MDKKEGKKERGELILIFIIIFVCKTHKKVIWDGQCNAGDGEKRETLKFYVFYDFFYLFIFFDGQFVEFQNVEKTMFLILELIWKGFPLESLVKESGRISVCQE